MQKILVWDWPVRIGHWLMAAGFAIAWLTAESESLHVLHIAAGATVLAVASFRLPWGLIGSRYARFRDFVRGPQQIRTCLKQMLKLAPPETVGHNPAGAVAIVLLLACGILTSLLGWALEAELAGHWLEEVHEFLAGLMLTVVAVHLLGVVAGSLLHGENLVRAMLTGYKQGTAQQAIRSARPLAAVVLIAWIVTVCWYLLR